MNKCLREIALCFAAGCAGGVANSIVVWLFGVLGVTSAFGVSIAPSLSPAWLYPRVVWGGLWGFLFLIPILKDSQNLRGLLWSVGPSLVQLFIVFPLKAKKGVMGFQLGALTPAFVLFFNAVWGLKAAAILSRIERGDSGGTSPPS
ncbi:MAG: hypothetical protein ACE5JQ_13720 [Candidatus Methylomirabilales bacterium]